MQLTEKNWSDINTRLEQLQSFENWAAEEEGRTPREVRRLSEIPNYSEEKYASVGGEFLQNSPDYIFVNDRYLDNPDASMYSAMNVVGHEGIHAAQYDCANGQLYDGESYSRFCQENGLDDMLDKELMSNSLNSDSDYMHHNYEDMPHEICARDGGFIIGEKYCNEELLLNSENAEHARNELLNARGNSIAAAGEYSEEERQKAGIHLETPSEADALDMHRQDVHESVKDGYSTMASLPIDGHNNGAVVSPQDTLYSVANDAERTQSNLEQDNTTETLKNCADQASLPETDQSNAQGNEQNQTYDNAQNI